MTTFMELTLLARELIADDADDRFFVTVFALAG